MSETRPQAHAPPGAEVEMSKIALVDDNQDFLSSFSRELGEEGFGVATFSDGEAALHAFRQEMPDVAVLDRQLPQMERMALLRRLRQVSSLPILILSDDREERDAIHGLRLGADAYLERPCSSRVLLERIRALLRRRKIVTEEAVLAPTLPTPQRHRDLFIDPLAHEVQWKGKDVLLTLSEFLLLRPLAEQPGVVLSRDQLLDALSGNEDPAQGRSIDGHIKRLRKKFRESDPDFSAIETLYGVGYRFSADAEPRGRQGI